MFSRRSAVGPCLRALSVTVLVLAVWGGGATAAADEEARVSWSVAPANTEGPDGRHWVELELDPGGQATDYMAVQNLSAQPVTFALSAADGYFTPTGRFSMLNDPSQSADAGTWIAIAQTVTVEAKEMAVVPFTVTVPPDAMPGDHAAGVAASITSAGTAEGGAAMGVTSRFGFRVMTRVTGELRPGLEVSAVTASFEPAWNPVRPGHAHVSFDLVNTGNARLTVTGAVTLRGSAVAFPAGEAPTIELMPRASHRVEVAFDGVWPWFFANAVITAEPVAFTYEGSQVPAVDPVETSFRFLTPPWSQLACLVAFGLILVAVYGGRMRSYRRVSGLVARARAEERARLEGESPAQPDAETRP